MPTASSTLLSCAAGLACLLAATSAKAEIIFCNKFPHLVYAAMAYPQDDGSWISRGWMALNTGECSLFDTALRVKTFYFRGESERYRVPGTRRSERMVWGKGRDFAIWENPISIIGMRRGAFSIPRWSPSRKPRQRRRNRSRRR